MNAPCSLVACIVWIATAIAAAGTLRGQARIAGTSFTEAGAPPFTAVGLEALGLSAPPTSMCLLPDGRLLVTAPRQLAIGDGVRWQVFGQAPSDPVEGGLNPVV